MSSVEDVAVYIWHRPVLPETVDVFVSERQKCYFCQKGFGHSFVSVSTCAHCYNVIGHTRCIDERDKTYPYCPLCHDYFYSKK